MLCANKRPASAEVHSIPQRWKVTDSAKELQDSVHSSRPGGVQHSPQDTHTVNSCQLLLEILLYIMVLTCLQSRSNRMLMQLLPSYCSFSISAPEIQKKELWAIQLLSNRDESILHSDHPWLLDNERNNASENTIQCYFMLELFYELLLCLLEDDPSLTHCVPTGTKFQKLYKVFSNCMFCSGFQGKQSHFVFIHVCLSLWWPPTIWTMTNLKSAFPS